MNELEDRIAETLHRHGPVLGRPMPKGTIARVRARQAGRTVVTLAAAAALIVGTVGVLSAVPRLSHPAARWIVQPPSGILSSPQGESGGVDDATAAPTGSAATGEDTTAHGTTSMEPYTEQVQGQEVYLLTQKHAVAVGHVSGVEWSLAAYDTRAYSGDLFRRFLGGQCGDLMVGDQGEYGGISFCLHTGETSPGAQFAMAGFGNDSDAGVGPMMGYAGLVGGQATSIELQLANGVVKPLPLYDAPSGIDARYFEVFVTPGASGRIVALGSDGTELGHGSLCISAPPSGPANVGCGHGLQDVSSVVTTLSPPPSLP